MAPADSPYAQTVCVMDASGHLGMNLVERLLERGYTVHAAVQNQGDMQPFKGCENKNLRIFRSDPLDYQSIMDAMKGCSGLFYTFEPPQDQSAYDEFMTEVEVRAAHNVLEACAQTETMAKVVFASSITAVIWREKRNKSTTDLDERNWSDPNFCRNFKLWHALSKTLAEKTAWALAMDRDVNMVSINAGLLTGPDLSIANPYLKGAAEMYEDGVFVTVDVKFLVEAHICVFEDSSTYGRYLCFDHLINRPEDAVKLAQMLLPATPYPQSCENSGIFQQRISNKKLNKLMVDFTSGIQLEA
ncbi:cinnamoyl-CoA reductase-like SNL6 [Tasmannia lanceolata]|uniref:cinnamoyl-CoA reductase-like SNL6 n=1 Tax=Tasmannia lanceolata TaxID=3420 RepID=UPI004062F00F